MRAIGAYAQREGAPQLWRRAREHAELLALVLHSLPEPLSRHCVAAAKDGDRLIVFAESSVWATRLRFLGPDLCRSLSETGTGFTALDVRITPPDRTLQRVIPPPRAVSPAIIALLHQTASSLGEGELCRALQRLAQAATTEARPTPAGATQLGDREGS